MYIGIQRNLQNVPVPKISNINQILSDQIADILKIEIFNRHSTKTSIYSYRYHYFLVPNCRATKNTTGLGDDLWNWMESRGRVLGNIDTFFHFDLCLFSVPCAFYFWSGLCPCPSVHSTQFPFVGFWNTVWFTPRMSWHIGDGDGDVDQKHFYYFSLLLFSPIQ